MLPRQRKKATTKYYHLSDQDQHLGVAEPLDEPVHVLDVVQIVTSWSPSWQSTRAYGSCRSSRRGP